MRVRRAAAVIVVAAGAMLPLVGVASAQDGESVPVGLSFAPAQDDDDDESGSTNDDESNDDDSNDDNSNQVDTMPQGGVDTGDGSTVA
jgi:hypothetical protein